MAKQTGAIKITGTIDGICFYKMDGNYYARQKSSLDGKRFWRDPKFARSRKRSRTFGLASGLASRLYRKIAPHNKIKGVFQVLTGRINQQLVDGRKEKEIEYWFASTYLDSETKDKTQLKSITKIDTPASIHTQGVAPSFPKSVILIPSKQRRKKRKVRYKKNIYARLE